MRISTSLRCSVSVTALHATLAGCNCPSGQASKARAPQRLFTLGLSAVLLIIGLTVFRAAQAEVTYWIGRPTIGDYVRHSMQNSLQAAQRYQQSARAAEIEISEARRAYFTASSSKQRQSAGDEFGKHLFAKDIAFAMPFISNGFTNYTASVNRLTARLNGGRPIDGGIPASARPSFDAWIRAMRAALGARSDKDVLFIVNAGKFSSAMQSTKGVYSTYRQARDLAETQAWQASKVKSR